MDALTQTELAFQRLQEEIPLKAHCQSYLHGNKCHKGDWCNKMHQFPRVSGLKCEDFQRGECDRLAEDCWFYHDRVVVEETCEDEHRHTTVSSMGATIKHLRQKNKDSSPALPTPHGGEYVTPGEAMPTYRTVKLPRLETNLIKGDWNEWPTFYKGHGLPLAATANISQKSRVEDHQTPENSSSISPAL